MKRFSRAADLRFLRAGGRELATAGATTVAIDAYVRAVLAACEGCTEEELAATLDRGSGVTRPLLAATLTVLERAGLLVSDAPAPLSRPEPPSPAAPQPKVSVIILNFNGERHLRELLPTVAAQTYPALETIVVDNASRDGSAAFVRAEHPGVVLLPLRRSVGFARANNAGLARATGEYFFLLNNDTTLDPDCIAHLVAAARARGRVGAVAARMMLHGNPRFVNSLGNSVSERTWGADNFLGCLDVGQFTRVRPVFSACFGAALIPRAALEEVGPLDAGYGFYYEDADWCYRARLRGLRIVAAPDALVYHKFSATMNERPAHFKLRLAAASRLRFALKNLEGRNALRFAANYALREDLPNLAGRLARGDLAGALVYARAYAGIAASLPRLALLRARTQRSRRRGARDERLLRAILAWPAPLLGGAHPELSLRTIRAYYLHVLR